MSKSDVVVIDYGVGNLLSVRRGLEYWGASVQISADPEVIRSAARVVLPGVGAFANAMAELQRLHLDEVVREVAKRGAPLLGICLGMQLLLDESDEFGKTEGLGLIPGKVIAIPTQDRGGVPLKVPHVGWSELFRPENQCGWENSLLRDVKPGESVYFVHSFMASPEDPTNYIAKCRYGDVSVCAVIGRDNIYGCQFHPEKSGATGLKILNSFLTS